MEKVSSTQIKGKITELNVALYFLKLGYVVSQPIIDMRYDYLLDTGDHIYKIQIKSCRTNETKDYIEFNSSNTHINTQGTVKKSYQDQIDFFATFYEGQCYLIPVEECGKTKKLRLTQPRNNQTQDICWAKDYTAEKILNYQPDETLSAIQDVTITKTVNAYCVDCGKPISKRSTRCVDCENIRRKEDNIPISREELKSLIRQTPFTKIGEQFGISDNAIRKWCDKFNLPRKKSDINKYSDEEWAAL